ncbi:MAG: ATP-dependent helicase, partial [Ignisphaera sp.]
EYNLEKHAAKYIYEYIYEQLLFTGVVPSDKNIVIEIWRDRETSSTNIIVHSLFGRRVNDVLSRVYAYILSKKLNESIRISVTDNGFMLSFKNIKVLDQTLKQAIEETIKEVTVDNVEVIARRAIRKTELFKKRFRHCAERSFMLLRRYKGIDVSLAKRQINSEKLIEIIEKYPKFPIIEETYREILEDVMDLAHAKEVINKVHNNEIEIRFSFSYYAPSPFAHHIIAFGYSDIVLMEDKRRLIAKFQDIVKKVLEQKINMHGNTHEIIESLGQHQEGKATT